MRGYCEADEQKWYFDAKFKQCMQFRYSGCLGNTNRFDNREECEQSCVTSDSLSVCEQPVERGPCQGGFER